jgi:hypothetical protein
MAHQINSIKLKINFSDFWPGFDNTNNFFYNLLAERYSLVIADEPDLLFYSVYGSAHIRYKCTKILYTGEPQRPDFVLCDFAFSYDYPVTRRNYRLPLYALYGDVTQLVNRVVDAADTLKQKKKFCCFIVSNGACKTRNDFFHNLSKYKRVDSGGRVFNNIGGPIENKLEFIKEYKFVIAFESKSRPGYTSEKIFEPLQQNTIPIYWGDPLVSNDFNTKSFINCHDYPSFEAVIDHITEVDKKDELYMQYLLEPAFTDNELNEFVKKENIAKQLDEIVAYHFNGKLKFLPMIRPWYFLLLGSIQSIKSALSFTKNSTMRVIRKVRSTIGDIPISNGNEK